MGLDSFFGLDDADGQISPEKVREYKARMARNQQMMAAARKQEQKQKKKEDKLFLILIKFIKSHTNSELAVLISRCLEQNIPAVFILAIILLGNEEIQKELGIRFELPGAIPDEEDEGTVDSSGESLRSLPDPEEDEDVPTRSFAELENPETKNALIAFGEDNAFPLKMRIAIDLWGKNMWDAISPIPERMFKTACEFQEDQTEKPEPKPAVIQLTAFVLRAYFNQHHFNQSFENIYAFARFFITGLFVRLKEQVGDQKELGGEIY